MTKHIEMTQDEKALLLFLETCHVDHVRKRLSAGDTDTTRKGGQNYKTNRRNLHQ